MLAWWANNAAAAEFLEPVAIVVVSPLELMMSVVAQRKREGIRRNP
jgi:hypothetical protein